MDRGRVVFDGRPAEFLANPPYSPAGPWRDGVASELASTEAVR
jgi:hypothetical protein